MVCLLLNLVDTTYAKPANIYSNILRMGKVMVGPSAPLTDQISIGANDGNIDIVHIPKHNSDNENIVIHSLPACGCFNVIPVHEIYFM